MTKYSSGYRVGDSATTAAITVTEAHLVAWSSLTGDWLPIHTDREFAAQSQFGQRLVHGPFTLALALGLSTQIALIDRERTMAWLGLNNLRALAPTFINDTIRARLTVADVRESKKNPGRYVVTLDYTVLNQRDEQVMTFSSVLMVKGVPVTD